MTSVKIDAEGKRAQVIVPEDQLSVAIGKGGQNVRLASKLTGFEIDINADKVTPASDDSVASPQPLTVDKVQKPKLKRKSDLENSLLSAIDEHAE